MEKPPFQFGLKAVFAAMVSVAALLAMIHYAPSAVLAIAATILVVGMLLAMGSILAARLFVASCLGIGRLIQRRKPRDG